MIQRVATPYDQNPARISLVLKDRRNQPKSVHRSVFRIIIPIGTIAMLAANYFMS